MEVAYPNQGSHGRSVVHLLTLFLLWANTASSQEFTLVEQVDTMAAFKHLYRWTIVCLRHPEILPKSSVEQLQKLLDDRKPKQAIEKMQKLLNPHCLLGVHINPESRVKAHRGPANAQLKVNTPAFFLVRIHNEGGVKAKLAVQGDALRVKGQKPKDGQWLEASIVHIEGLPKTLTGHRLQYALLRLNAHEVGKREVTLQMDAGQGTQDLGFRAEVPILFKISR